MPEGRTSPVVLDEISVRNLGIIPDARIEPGAGLVVITGETGAGKTLLLGALRLLSGETAHKDQIGPAGDEAVVEARMISADDEVILARRVGASRSRAYIDGSMVTAGALAEQLAPLVEIVGQHDRNALADPGTVRRLVDGALDAAGSRARADYDDAWKALTVVEARIAQLGGDQRALERELDMLRFQAAEVDHAGFAAGDDDVLEATANRLRNAEELGERLAAAGVAVGEEGAGAALDRVVHELSIAAKTDPSLVGLADLGREAAALVGELNAEIAAVSADFDRDPGRLAEVEARLALLSDLKRKYGSDLDAVLAFAADASKRAERIDSLLGDAGELAAASTEALAALDVAGTNLALARRGAATRLAAAATVHLTDLGFSDPLVRFRLEPTQAGPTGADRITLEFASDAALQALPATRIASGGELSRLVLSLRLAAGVADAGIVAFDEIDAGTGGATALAMGRKLADLADGRQVFCVTHLPQVAAFADRHFAVRRDGTTATVALVEGDERVEELSRMLAGLPESDRGKEHAAELLVLAEAR
jgi:DNA repair protein RecN (Recombination protein N)